jgi:methylenetetrahydrofolate dehydrogenase (NADP+)/methenyltetrahydrofolate cyclohydrolase
MTKLILGKEIAEQEIYPKIPAGANGQKPILVTFYNSKDKLGLKYVQLKEKLAKAHGIAVKLEPYQSFEKDLARVHQLNSDRKITGILLQLPMPQGYSEELIYSLNPQKDVDGLASKFFISPVVRAAERALQEIPGWQEKKILVAGQGEFVGKKIFHYLKRFSNQIQAVDNDAALQSLLPQFEIIISCVGKPKLINRKNFQGIAAIDVGTMVTSAGKVVGDIDLDLKEKLEYLAPVPGGVGPLTLAYLIDNVWQAKIKFGI